MGLCKGVAMPRYSIIPTKSKINGYLTTENTTVGLTTTPTTIASGITIENNVGGFSYANGIVSVPKSGYYMFFGDSNFSLNSSADVTFGLYKNDSLIAGAATRVNPSTDRYGQLSINRIQLFLAAGDTIRIKASVSTGTPTLTVQSLNYSLIEL
jgi:hypothetical protein